jgi:tetratricopeptide (TPR) repeat protein
LLSLSAPARGAERLFEQDPFDRITLDEANSGAVLKVKPLDLPERRLPENPQPDDKLLVHLPDQPDKTFEIHWASIKKVELFEQMVLDKANELVAAGKGAEAHDYFKFLEEQYPKLPGLRTAIEDYLYAEAKVCQRKQQYPGALAVLRELYRRNPQRPGLDKAMGVATEKLVEQHVAAENHAAARALLRNLAACYGNHPTATQWQGQFHAQAAGLMAAARAAEQSGDLRKAAELTRQLARIWPALAGAKELAESLHRRHPHVAVGVCTPAEDVLLGPLDNWAARRSSRLVYRTLTEFRRPGPSGGEYACPVGELTAEKSGRRWALRLKPDLRWSAGEAALTGYDVSRRLLALADPADAAYHPDWAQWFAAVAVRDVYQVDIDLRKPHLHAQALLQTILPACTVPSSARSPVPLSNGPYVIYKRSGAETTYLANAQYFAAAATQPKEIAERHFAEGAAAIRAIRSGEIQVLDRANPWDLPALRADKRMVVHAYALPLVHCLIPNMRKPLTADRAFRRALVYGIHRQAILDELLAGAALPGARVLSGPFPCGLSAQDPIGYACDANIKPRDYDPPLAIALAGARLKEGPQSASEGDSPIFAAPSEGAARKLGQSPGARKLGQSPAARKLGQSPAARKLGQSPGASLVLGHPPHEIARTACRAMRRHLELVGIPVTLKELPADWQGPIPAEVDLLYAELAVWEPLVDARRLLGEDGLSGGCSPQMSLALRQLDQAADWSQVCAQLRRIHRVAHDDVAVIPLWQLPDHFVCQVGLQGIDSAPITLYENIEKWQLGFQYPAD